MVEQQPRKGLCPSRLAGRRADAGVVVLEYLVAELRCVAMTPSGKNGSNKEGRQ